jgi:hypothetical protein
VGSASDEADVEDIGTNGGAGGALDKAVIESFRQPMSLNIS